MRPFPTRLRRCLNDHGRGLTILVVRLGALGDVVRTLPSVRLVRFALPDARIVWAIDDRWAPLLSRHADLDARIVLQRETLGRFARAPRRWPHLIFELAALRRELRAGRPDLVLDFHGNLRSGVVGLLSGAPVRLGHGGHQQKEGNRWMTTHRVPADGRRTSRMERNLGLVRALDLPVEPVPDAGLPFTISGARGARGVIRSCNRDGRPFALLAAGASRSQGYKKPPPHLLAAGATALAARGILPIVVWGPGEQDEAREVVRLATGAAVAAPETDVATLIALLRDASVFVGGDTGPLHLACGTGCPVVGIYGPTDPAVNAPWGVPHAVVQPSGRSYTGIKRRDRRSGGFRGIGTQAVIDAVERVLGDAGQARSGSGAPLALDSPGEPVRRE